jgi:D-glycero-D-manno-heptose 1,7-bisphosphate phosphatase
MALTPAIFLDKDGTVLRNVPFNVDPSRMEFELGVHDGLGLLQTLGRPIFIISNQPGVGLRLFDGSALDRVRARLSEMFIGAGSVLAGWYCCPHKPAGRGEAAGCACRKPAPGLLLSAAADHGLDLQRSWMVGDILDDVEAGTRAGCRTALVDNGNETAWIGGAWREPTLTAPSFGLAAREIVQIETSLQEAAA